MATYLHSGNVVFTTSGDSMPPALAERLARQQGPQDRTTARNWRTVETLARLLDT